ncbi:MAG: YetF domain-containing protein [Thermomonas sp.]
MSELFELSAPWWQFVLRSIVIYVLVIVLVRLSGKRAVGQFTPFDLVLVILIGNAVQNGINGGDNSLTGAAIMASTLIVLNYLVALLTARHRSFEKIVEGEPVVLARDGQVFKQVLRRELISQHDFDEALRLNNIDDVAEVEVALLETNGRISVVPKQRS